MLSRYAQLSYKTPEIGQLNCIVANIRSSLCLLRFADNKNGEIDAEENSYEAP